MSERAVNDTISKFYSEDRFVFETSHWLCVVRPKQVTLASTILMSKSHEASFAALTPDELVDLGKALQRLENAYQATFKPDKINYLALMMVDPNPHFHVLPRYAHRRSFGAKEYRDGSWPKPPDMSSLLSLSDDELPKLAALLRNAK